MLLSIKRVTTGFVALIMVASVILVGQAVVAQEGPSGSGLRISPTKTQLTITQGDNREVVQTVKNVTQNAVRVQASLNDFESDGVTGEPKLIGDPNETSAYSLREFISLPEDFELQPDEEREVTVQLFVPEGSSPGAYYGSVLFRATPVNADDDGQVALVASVGSLVLIEVPGEITERIQVNSLSAYLDNNKGSLFTKKPDQIGIEIENLGNSFSQPFGKVSVKDWRNNEIFVYELNDSQPRGNILPTSTRLFLNDLANVESKVVNGEEQTTFLNPLKWPGRYKVTANVSHGTSGEIFTVSTTFWYVPAWLIIVLLVVLAVLVGGAIWMYRRYVTKSTRRK